MQVVHFLALSIPICVKWLLQWFIVSWRRQLITEAYSFNNPFWLSSQFSTGYLTPPLQSLSLISNYVLTSANLRRWVKERQKVLSTFPCSQLPQSLASGQRQVVPALSELVRGWNSANYFCPRKALLLVDWNFLTSAHCPSTNTAPEGQPFPQQQHKKTGDLGQLHTPLGRNVCHKIYAIWGHQLNFPQAVLLS